MGEAAAQAEGSVSEDIPKVVIDQKDEDAIRQLLDEFLQHTRSPDVCFSSKIDIHDGLMDVYAVSTRYGDIIRRAAEAMKLKVTIGPVRGLDVITTVRMKSVTFDEFLHILGKTIDLKGPDLHKHAEGYRIGS
jgi:hypothetical protein